MILWSGHGYLVAVVVFVSSLVMELATEEVKGNDQFYQESAWAFPLALLLAGAISFAIDRVVFANSDRSHSLFFIPMRLRALILAVLAVVVFAFNAIN